MIPILRRILAPGLWCLLLLTLLALGGRMLWFAGTSKIGVAHLWPEWRSASLGWVSGEYKPVVYRPAQQQAAYWLAATEHLVESDDAELAIGAAVVLDQPDLRGIHLNTYSDQHASDFRQLTSERCLQLATRATELEPERVAWWQLRAMLLLRNLDFPLLPTKGDIVRADNWESVLRECAQHDADNALYDYLAAYLYWQTGLNYDAESQRLIIEDWERIKRGNRCFQRAQAKERLAISHADLPAALKFLSTSSLPPLEQPAVGRYPKGGQLVRGLVQMQDLERKLGFQEEHGQTKVKKYCQVARLMDQYSKGTPASVNDHPSLDLLQWFAERAHEALLHNPELLDDVERQEFIETDRTALIERDILATASNRFLRQTTDSERKAVELADAAQTWLPQVVSSLLFFAMVGLALSRFSAQKHLHGVGMWGHVGILFMSLAVCFTAFGLCPVEIVPVLAQVLLAVALPALGITAIGFLVLPKREIWRVDQRMVLAIAVLVAGAVGSRFVIVANTQGAMNSFPWRHMHIPKLHSDDAVQSLDAVWQTIDGIHIVPWTQAVNQWLLYRGYFITLAVWAVVVAIVLGFRFRRLRREEREGPSEETTSQQVASGAEDSQARNGAADDSQSNEHAEPSQLRTTFRELAATFGRTIYQPSLSLAGIILAVYFVAILPALHVQEREFQHELAFRRDPDTLFSRIRHARDEIRRETEKAASGGNGEEGEPEGEEEAEPNGEAEAR